MARADQTLRSLPTSERSRRSRQGLVRALLLAHLEVLMPESESKFLEGCWTEVPGWHLRIEEDTQKRIHIIIELGPGGQQIINIPIAEFRRDRLSDALRKRESDA